MAVDVVVPAAHRGLDGGGATAAFPISTPVAAASAICIAASAHCVSTRVLSYYATFAVSLVCFARAVWPDRVDGTLARAGAYARHKATLARADLEADLRHLKDAAARAHPLIAAAHAAAEERARHARAAVAAWADRARRRAEARWDKHRDAARAARLVLRLVALVARLAATVLFDAACDEARARAPSALGYLRGVVDGIRSPSSRSKGEGGEDEAAAGFVLKDVVCLVGAGFYLLFTGHLLFFGSNAASGTQSCAVCFAAACGLTTLIADWIHPPDDADGTDTAAGTDGSHKDKGDAAGEASQDEQLEVRESWRFLWVLILVTYCVDAFLLHVTLGPQPVTLAILALCDLEILKVGRQVQLTPDGGEGAAEGSAQGVVNGAVDKWRRGAMVVYAVCSVKILVVYLALDYYLAALSFFWLFIMADLLLAEEDNLSFFDDSGEADEDAEESAGFQGDITRGDEEEAGDEAREEHSNSNTNSSEDEEECSAHCVCDSSSEDEEETSEHYDSSEEHDIVEEHQRYEGQDCGSGSSTDDGWDLVDVDPEMPAKANCGANRKSRLFPWRKHAS